MRKPWFWACTALLAVGAASAGSSEVDFDPKAAFESFKTWAWVPDRDQGHHGVLVDATLREGVETALARIINKIS